MDLFKLKEFKDIVKYSESNKDATLALKLAALAEKAVASENTLPIDIVNRCASQIPTTWLDPLLTGKDAALTDKAGKWGCPDIENLLRAIKNRIIKYYA